MPQQFVIKGAILLDNQNGILNGIIQAFDNDLPSLNREPALLGESLVDENGNFTINYTFEQFHAGEADIMGIRSMKDKYADLSFRITDRTGHERPIKSIEALNRTYEAGAIIFNAPAQLDVRIFMDALPATGDSEFEQLMAVIVPVIENLPIAALTDADTQFLFHELGIEERVQPQQFIEWLRRSALLARQTNIPVEAFYGWGRKDLPARFDQLVKMNVIDLPDIPDKLLAETNQTLMDRLLKAIDEKIIPALFKDQVNDVVRQFRRYKQQRLDVIAQLVDGSTGQPLSGYSVTTTALEEKEDLGLDITDAQGLFTFTFFIGNQLPADAPPPAFVFTGHTADGEVFPESERIEIRRDHPASEIVRVSIHPPRQPVATLQELQRNNQLNIPNALLTNLAEQGIKTLADIRRRGSLQHLPDLSSTDTAAVRKLESLADLDRLSSNIKINIALQEHNYETVLAIADAPQPEFIQQVKAIHQELSESAARQLHVMARAQTSFLNNMLTAMAVEQANGFNYTTTASNNTIQ